MTLFHQINSLLFGLFLLVMSSLVYFQFDQTKSFMDSQIESDLNNTTHALTLMLQPHLETGDIASAETVVNVIFEGGFYRKVSLTWLANKRELTWENPIQVRGVPEWFLGLQLFESKSTETTITNGWMQLATLKIEANPAIAYRQLWRVMNDTLMVLSAMFILSVIALQLRLKRILSPLHRIAEQAKLIAKREFQPDITLPKTSELKEVVLAINSMSDQLKNVFTKLDKEVIALKHDKLTDHVSHLPNRLLLNTQLDSWLKEPGYGGLMIAKLEWLEAIHHQYGFQVRDKTIQILAKELQATLLPVAPSVIARISNLEFAFLVTKASPEHLKVYLKTLKRVIKQAIEKAGYVGDSHFYVGCAVRGEDMNASQLLGEADKALQQAIRDNKESFVISPDQDLQVTISQWHEYLSDAIEKKQFLLQIHPVLSFDGKILQSEIYCRIKINNQIIRAGKFMPQVELLNLGSLLDLHLLETVELHPDVTKSEQTIAINISHDSINDEKFHKWLSKFIKRQSNPQRFCFELHESSVLSATKQSRAFAKLVKQAGAHLGIDNCGREMGSLAYLQEIQPHYVKLDQSLSCNQSSIEVGQMDERLELAKAVINTARGLDIEVILTGIEEQQQVQLLKGLQAVGYQGFITAPRDIL